MTGNLLALWMITLSVLLCPVRAQAGEAPVVSAPAAASPRVGMWLHPDVELDEWICHFETNPEQPPMYVHSTIQPSSWRQVAAHSSVIALNNFIFAHPLPWSVLQNTRTYAQYIDEFAAASPDSPEGVWFRRLNDNLRTPLAGLSHSGDPVAHKLVYIYAHMFGYNPDHAISLGLTPLDIMTYAWPPPGLDRLWPESFLFDDDGAGALLPRPSFKQPATRTAMANAVYFFIKHFESVGAKVYLSPWREINGYADPTRCPDEHGGCGLDSWQDLYDTYQAIIQRVADGGFDPARIAIYPTFQLESFIGINNSCVEMPVVDMVKQFYGINAASGVPFSIGISTYPSVEETGLATYRSRLQHLLDNLDSTTPVACNAMGENAASPENGIKSPDSTASLRVPRATPLTIGETSRPPWLTFQAQDAPTVMANEKLGATLANTHLHYEYRATDKVPAYPLEFVAFALGPNWAFPVTIHGVRSLWLTTASGIARHWLTPMQPFAGQLLLDGVLDADGDWDNDGVPNITFSRNPFTAGREVRRGLDDYLYSLVRDPEEGWVKESAELDDIAFTTDNCPYMPNASQADADGDGLGDGCDNCSQVPNYAQEDLDQDGFGNACDADLNNDGLLQVEVDLATVLQCQGGAMDCLARLEFPDLPSGQRPPDLRGKVALIADLNSDATIDASDVTAWHRLAANTELRASGLACAGSVPCPDPAVVMLRDGSTVTIPGVAPGQRQCAPAH